MNKYFYLHFSDEDPPSAVPLESESKEQLIKDLLSKGEHRGLWFQGHYLYIGSKDKFEIFTPDEYWNYLRN